MSAPFEVRVRRVAQRTGQLARRLRPTFAAKWDRQQYLQRYYHSKRERPLQYDLQINTGTVPFEAAARLVLALVQARGFLAFNWPQ